MKDLVTHEIFEDFLKDEVSDEEDWKTSCLQYSVNNLMKSYSSTVTMTMSNLITYPYLLATVVASMHICR